MACWLTVALVLSCVVIAIAPSPSPGNISLVPFSNCTKSIGARFCYEGAEADVVTAGRLDPLACKIPAHEAQLVRGSCSSAGFHYYKGNDPVFKKVSLWFDIPVQQQQQPPPLNYASLPARGKADALWALITEDEAGGAFMNPLETLVYAGSPAYLNKMQDTHSDWREPGHKKITHGKGAQARAHIRWLPNPYSGMFQRADHCIIRMANAAMPGTLAMTAYGPNLAIKCLNDGPQSANLLAIWQLDGYAELPLGKQKSCSYFEAPLSSHTPLRDNIVAYLRDTFVSDFQKVDPHSMLVGVSQFAKVAEAGGPPPPASSTHFPFALVYRPRAGLNDVPCEFEQYTSQLLHPESFGNGTILYDIYAVAEPWTNRTRGPTSLFAGPNITRIGELILDSPFVSSTFGDSRLFFRHTFFGSELRELELAGQEDRMVEWLRYTNNTEFMKSEGAMLYQHCLICQYCQACYPGS